MRIIKLMRIINDSLRSILLQFKLLINESEKIMEKKVIKRNGQTVNCYGDYDINDCVVIVGTDLDNDYEIETTMEDNSNCNNWTEVVEEVTLWAKENNCEIDELYCD